jgi:hypothetical protein
MELTAGCILAPVGDSYAITPIKRAEDTMYRDTQNGKTAFGAQTVNISTFS